MSNTEKSGGVVPQLTTFAADTPITTKNLNQMVEAIRLAFQDIDLRLAKDGGTISGSLEVAGSLTRGGNTVYDTGNRPTPEEIGEKCIYRSLYIEQASPVIITTSIKPDNDKFFLLDIKVNTNTDKPVGALIQGYQNSSQLEIQNAACVVYSGTIDKEIVLGFVDSKLCVFLPAMPPKAMLYVGVLADPNGLPNVDQYTVEEVACGPVPAVVNRKVTVMPAHTYSADHLPTQMAPDNKKEMNLLVGCSVGEVALNSKGPAVRTELIRMEDGLGQGTLTDILARNVKGAVAVYDGSQRVYSPNNKPSAADVGAVPGKMHYSGTGNAVLLTGNYLIFGNVKISYNTSDYKEGNFAAICIKSLPYGQYLMTGIIGGENIEILSYAYSVGTADGRDITIYRLS